jgi:hypothetical protein
VNAGELVIERLSYTIGARISMRDDPERATIPASPSVPYCPFTSRKTAQIDVTVSEQFPRHACLDL